MSSLACAGVILFNRSAAPITSSCWRIVRTSGHMLMADLPRPTAFARATPEPNRLIADSFFIFIG
nr:MAG TPA: hypothetical protein [Caudoviricetes sp.]